MTEQNKVNKELELVEESQILELVSPTEEQNEKTKINQNENENENENEDLESNQINDSENLREDEDQQNKLCSAKIISLKTDSKFTSLLILIGTVILFFGFYVFSKHSGWAIVCFSFGPLFLVYGSYLVFYRFYHFQQRYFDFEYLV
ncbi:hypothetical protein M0811_04252 [Anaeramoeba ignava]|uniref:Transmembrane protein n=1 Tax=Anaeramoeba ignava TaxID=1746090 RepID=A0A9Q0LV47_ANAIG|nr:hypothetical protein M0811_04252 [Anaeramoeba ignava]